MATYPFPRAETFDALPTGTGAWSDAGFVRQAACDVQGGAALHGAKGVAVGLGDWGGYVFPAVVVEKDPGVAWVPGDHATWALRGYFWIGELTGTTWAHGTVLMAPAGYSFYGGFGISEAGQPYVFTDNGSARTLFGSTGMVTNGAWFRAELKYTESTKVLQARLFIPGNKEGVTPDASTSVTLSAHPAQDGSYYGYAFGSGERRSAYSWVAMDSIALATDWVGPIVLSTPVDLTGQGIASTTAVGQPTVTVNQDNVDLTGQGIASTAQVGQPGVASMDPVQVSIQGISPSTVFGEDGLFITGQYRVGWGQMAEVFNVENTESPPEDFNPFNQRVVFEGGTRWSYPGVPDITLPLSASDAVAASISESTSIAIAEVISAADSIPVVVTESVLPSVLLSASDSIALAVTDSGLLNSGAISAADSATISISESASTLSQSQVYDGATITVSELVSTSVLTAGTDVVPSALSETASIVSAVSVSDAISISMTDAASIASVDLKSASDSVSVSIAESVSIIDAIAVSAFDAVSLSITESTTTGVHISSSEIIPTDVTEVVSIAGSMSAVELVPVEISDVSVTACSFQASDTTAVSITETSIVGLGIYGSDGVTVTISESSVYGIGIMSIDLIPITISETYDLNASGALQGEFRTSAIATSDIITTVGV